MMEDLLNCKDLYDPIEGDNVKSSDMLDVFIRCHSPMGGHQSLQSCCQRDRSTHSLEELGKHVQEKERTSKDFLDTEANEFEAQGRSINC